VSGQLQAETAALALGKVYTFGPTFRAENSNTTRHLAEFWMIEPVAAFMDLHGDMDLAEGLCKHLITRVLRNSMDDLQFLDARLAEEEKSKPQDQRSEMGLIDRLKFVLENPFERITYDEAITILLRSKPYQKKKFQFPVEWGVDLQSEHERYLVEKHFKKPVIVTGYPAKIKAFYMRTNGEGDFGFSEKGKTVAAMDVLFPGIGEIIGGSQREERLDYLDRRMTKFGLDLETYSWYRDLRRYGTVPHAGFGLGFERLLCYVCGLSNIRDAIPYPRAAGSAEFRPPCSAASRSPASCSPSPCCFAPAMGSRCWCRRTCVRPPIPATRCSRRNSCCSRPRPAAVASPTSLTRHHCRGDRRSSSWAPAAWSPVSMACAATSWPSTCRPM
jgi:asparaginyl-tRNA synthetase